MTVKEVIIMLEEIAEKEGYNTEAEIHTVCTNGYQDGTKKICLLGTKDDETNEE